MIKRKKVRHKMPEGPEVATTAFQLNELLPGRLLERIKIINEGSFETTVDDLNLILPLKIDRVYSKGKKIIIETDKNLVICCKLGMTGRWALDRHKHAKIEFLFGNGKFITLKGKKLQVHDFKIFFVDVRMFGKVSLVSRDSLPNYLKDVGIDLLGQADLVTSDLYREVISDPKIQKWKIKKFLSDQQYFSGIGNYLKNDILWMSKISPERIIQKLSDDEIESLRINSLALIRESFEAGGLTISDYFPPNSQAGSYQTKVYGKGIDPLGNQVKRYKNNKADQPTFWVPEIQI